MLYAYILDLDLFLNALRLTGYANPFRSETFGVKKLWCWFKWSGHSDLSLKYIYNLKSPLLLQPADIY